MITKQTAADIWHAYREIEAGEKLLSDMEQERQRMNADRYAPTLRDAFGRVRQLQLGIPSGENSHKLFDVSPVIAEAVIRSHIEHKRAELAALQERASLELEGPSQ